MIEERKNENHGDSWKKDEKKNEKKRNLYVT